MAEPRFPCNVTSEGILVPEDPQRTRAVRGRRVYVSLHNKPWSLRSGQSNRFLWVAIYGPIAEATGSDPDTIHAGLKREAVRIRVLDPHYILIGTKLFEGEPTTKQEQEDFSRYVRWIVEGCSKPPEDSLVGVTVDFGEIEL
jgi:hypothetical protein